MVSDEATQELDILRRRAAELAIAPEPETDGDTVELLEFQVGAERYAFESRYVKEVFPLAQITPLPGLPDYVLGIINLRGRILSVMDIRRLLEFSGSGLTNLNKAVVVSDGTMEFGILADVIAGVRRVREEDLQAGLSSGGGRAEKYLEGITPDHVAVLDARGMLADEDLIVRYEL